MLREMVKKKYLILTFVLVIGGIICFYTQDYLRNFSKNLPSLYQHYHPPHSQDKQPLIQSSQSSQSSLLSSSLSSPSQQPPHSHVYYLKTHKTASSTMFAILSEYCRVHDLLPLLPTGVHINQGPPLREHKQLAFAGKIFKYDMVFHHHVFDPNMFTYLHNDTFTLTTIREPYDNFVSSFKYYRYVYRLPYLYKVPGSDPIMEFLTNQTKYEVGGFGSFTDNRQSMDLGYDMSHNFSDQEYIKTFIKLTEERFNLVLISEYFDEGLIMLKRRLHWKTQDVLYMTKNVGPKVIFKNENKTEQNVLKRNLHANFSQADILLYTHFKKIFLKLMKQEIGLEEEVNEFRQIQQEVNAYCKKNGKVLRNLFIHPRNWTKGFDITPQKCKLLSLNYTSMTRYLQTRQHAMLQDKWWRDRVSKNSW